MKKLRSGIEMKTNEFIQLLTLSQEECSKWVLATIVHNNMSYYTVTGSYIYVNNGSNCLLTSHLDTVDTHDKDFTGLKTQDIAINGSYLSVKDKTKVLGGDDRAGVEIMLRLINDGCRDYDYLFCFDEEIGGVGSSKFADDYSESLNNYGSFISLDRRGDDEVATYGYDNNNLVNVFTVLGYREVMGSFSDCCSLSSESDVACINLSVGYNNEHTSNEIQNLATIDTTYNVLNMGEVKTALTKIKYKQESRPTYYRDDWYDTDTPLPMLCECCGTHAPLYEIDGYYVCGDCQDFTEYIGISER